MTNLQDKLKILTLELNNIFANSNLDIKNILDAKNIKTRNNKLSFTDALLYKFLCAYKDNTNTKVVADLNFSDTVANKSNYYKKEQKIPLIYYQNTLSKVQQLFDKYTNKNVPYNVIAVDGTYNNTNFKNDKTLETTLNMGFFNVTQGVPINIELKHFSDKNKEICSFKDYVANNNLNVENVIFVMDRAYHSSALFKYLNDNNFKFIIRVRNNCIYLNKNKNKKNKNNNDENENYRYILYETSITETKKNKDNKDVSITKQLMCNIVTNLDSTYTEDVIKNMYKSRWDVEVYFKLIKANFTRLKGDALSDNH